MGQTDHPNTPMLQYSSYRDLDARAAAVIDSGRKRRAADKGGTLMAGNGSDAGFEVLISSDSHVMEPSGILAERAPQSYKDQVPRFPKLEVGSSFQTHPGGSDPTHRITEMETDGLSAEVLYPTY